MISVTPSGGSGTPPTSVNITGLIPFTNYTIRVRAIGQRLNRDNTLFGDIDREIIISTYGPVRSQSIVLELSTVSPLSTISPGPIPTVSQESTVVSELATSEFSVLVSTASSEKIFLESTTPPEPTVSSEPTTSQSTTSSTRDPIITYAIIGAVVAPVTIIMLVLAVVTVIIVWLYLNHKRAMMSFQHGTR